MGPVEEARPAAADRDRVPSFLHSGDAGDLIYALPAMLAKANNYRIRVLLGKHDKMVRNPWTPESAWSMSLLLNQQPYIVDSFWAPPGHVAVEGMDYFDCDPFRRRLLRHFQPGRTISDYVAEVLGVPTSCSQRPWLTVDVPMHVEGCPVLMCRTERYRNYSFPWHEVIKKYAGRIAFVGHQHEWETCCQMWGQIPYCPTETIWDLARLIAGCRLFIGNQSLALAIAEGFKKPVLMECWPKLPDTIWNRPNATAWLNKPVPLPEIP